MYVEPRGKVKFRYDNALIISILKNKKIIRKITCELAPKEAKFYKTDPFSTAMGGGKFSFGREGRGNLHLGTLLPLIDSPFDSLNFCHHLFE